MTRILPLLLLITTTIHAQTGKYRYGMYATLLETGKTTGIHENERFPMQSVYKFPIAMATLHQADRGRLHLDQMVHVTPADYIAIGHSPLRDQFPGGTDVTLRELLRLNVAESDGSACDVLLRLLGGTAKAQAYVESLGVKGMMIATTEKVQQEDPTDTIQYRNYSTPVAMTQLLKIFYTGNVLSEKSFDFLLNLMVTSTPGPHRIKGQLPEGTVVAHKTGTSAPHNGLTRATNDVGIITLPGGHHIAITVFVADAYLNEAARERIIADAAKSVWDQWKDH